jgi:hypothetical protein
MQSLFEATQVGDESLRGRGELAEALPKLVSIDP